MKKKQILLFDSFTGLGAIYTSYNVFLKLLSKNFENIYIVNTDNLRTFNRKNYTAYLIKKNKFEVSSIEQKYPNKIKFFNPKNFLELKIFLQNKNNLIINHIGRTFQDFRLLFFIARRKIPQIFVSNLGNLQGNTYHYMKRNIFFFKLLFTKHLPWKLCAILSSIGIFSKIDIRFTSNKKLYKAFYQNKKKLISKPSIYKDFILVKSRHFDHVNKIKKNDQTYITLLDLPPNYQETIKSTGEFSKKDVDLHYNKMNNFLNLLKSSYKKKIMICIHPMYDQAEISKIYKEFKVVKFQTRKCIQRSFIVLFFDSSAIVDAIVLKKRIIALRTNLLYEKRYNSDLYRDIINFKTVNIYKKNEFNKKKLITELNNKIKFYNKYLNEYSSMDIKNPGGQKIIDVIKKRYY